MSTLRSFLTLGLVLSLALSQAQDLIPLSVSSKSFTLIKGESDIIVFGLDSPLPQAVSIHFTESIDGRINWSPKTVNIPAGLATFSFNVSVNAESPGKIEIEGHSSPVEIVNDFDLFVKIVVANWRPLIIISVVVGWVYFAAWSISFYPQVILNFRRQSVVGLSFDFLALNIIGHSMYGVFNISLYFFKYFQDEYFRRIPHGMNPVELNDVFFSIHAVILTLFTIGQCFYYESGSQRVSKISWGIIAAFGVTTLVMIILSAVDVVHWLDFLYTCSYIKLAITLLKYIPQAYLNFKRKSTVGWSIENILLDFTGGILSMAQMMFNSYNYDDWASVLGDPTKFGLGLFSVLFDILFMLQHYVFYRHARKQPDETSKTDTSDVIDKA